MARAACQETARAEDAAIARRVLLDGLDGLDGLAAGSEILKLPGDLERPHPLNDKSPGEVLPHLAAGALE